MSTTIYRLPCGCELTLCERAVERKSFCGNHFQRDPLPCGCEAKQCAEAAALYAEVVTPLGASSLDKREAIIRRWHEHGTVAAFDHYWEAQASL